MDFNRQPVLTCLVGGLKSSEYGSLRRLGKAIWTAYWREGDFICRGYACKVARLLRNVLVSCTSIRYTLVRYTSVRYSLIDAVHWCSDYYEPMLEPQAPGAKGVLDGHCGENAPS